MVDSQSEKKKRIEIIGKGRYAMKVHDSETSGLAWLSMVVPFPTVFLRRVLCIFPWNFITSIRPSGLVQCFPKDSTVVKA